MCISKIVFSPILLICSFILCFQATVAQNYHWETVVMPGSNWSYIQPTSQPSSNWNSSSFDVSEWNSGPSGFGYGDADDATQTDPNLISVYMRLNFEIQNTAVIKELVLDMDYDDGFVAYLNGQEIARSLLSGDPVAFDQTSDDIHEANFYRGGVPERFIVTPSLLRNGTNVLAVQVHNESLGSSDLTALPVLSVKMEGDGFVYNEPPFWFQAPANQPITFESSNLPIVFLETEGGQQIPDEPKINAVIQIVERPDGERNLVADKGNEDFLDHEGPIKIEVRGSSSTFFSKQQYSLTTYDSDDEKKNVKLLGMAKENDWILSGIAFDTTFVRDYVSYKLSNNIGQYAAKGRYCEVVLNDNYQGIYVLQEKLKADGDRIDIEKIDEDHNSFPKLSGGYITKSDKYSPGEFAWSMPNYSGWNVDFVHVHPKPDEVTYEQNEYIKSVFENLAVQASVQNSALDNGYPSIIDVPSFIDFMLLNELASNVDAYQFSTYFHKDLNGKLRAGPVWDFNLTYGNDLFFWGYDRSEINLWQYEYELRGAKFWTDLANDAMFRCYMSKRWKELTTVGGALNVNEIHELIDATVALISEAVGRQEQQWGMDLGFDTQIYNLKMFINYRIDWISSQLNDTSLCDDIVLPPLVISKINYNPEVADDEESDDFEFFEITNTGTTTVDLTGVYLGGLGLTYQFPAGATMEGNSALVLANNKAIYDANHEVPAYDEFTRNLSNGGEEIELLDGYGNRIDYVDYDDKEPWPEAADGDGYFLELKDLSLDNNVGENWMANNSLSLADSKLSFFRLYPNPVEDVLLVEMPEGTVIKKMDLWSFNGKRITSFVEGESSLELNLSACVSGVYYLTIETSTQTFVRKIIKK